MEKRLEQPRRTDCNASTLALFAESLNRDELKQHVNHINKLERGRQNGAANGEHLHECWGVPIEAAMLWTETETRELITLWPSSSASQIARQLQRPKSAIIGKVKRLRDEGVLPRDAIKHYEVKPAQAVPKRSPPVTPRPAPALDGTVPCSILELDDSRCRWPLGEMHDVAVLFCGGVAETDRPYCTHHLWMARGDR